MSFSANGQSSSAPRYDNTGTRAPYRSNNPSSSATSRVVSVRTRASGRASTRSRASSHAEQADVV